MFSANSQSSSQQAIDTQDRFNFSQSDEDNLSPSDGEGSNQSSELELFDSFSIVEEGGGERGGERGENRSNKRQREEEDKTPESQLGYSQFIESKSASRSTHMLVLFVRLCSVRKDT